MEVLFEVNDPWRQRVRLTRKRWDKLLIKHPELREIAARDERRLLDVLTQTVRAPERVYEGKSAPDSKVFYSSAGAVGWADDRYRRVRLVAVVRSTTPPGSFPTVYVTVGYQANLGRLLYPEEGVA